MHRLKGKVWGVALVAVLLAVIIPFNLLAAERTYNFDERTPGNASLRSLILPGWGQFFNGQDTKGYIFLGAAAVAIGAAVMENSKANSAYSDYDAKRTSDLYDTYSKDVDTANLFVYLAAAIWIGNVADAYFSADNINAIQEPESMLPNRGFYLAAKDTKQVNLIYRYTF